MRTLSLIALLSLSGCLRTTEFHCQTDLDCGAMGRCEGNTFCSFFDPACDGSQQRFGESAGAVANTCVGGGPGGEDGGVDSSVDGPPAGCPNGYAALTGGNAGHLYKLDIVQSWPTARDACAATSSSAYLAIPDDAGELAALRTLIAASFWVGINDLVTENTFVNVKNMPQTFLPWRPGEPDNGQGGQDCVAGVSATEIATEKCNAQIVAICECEP